jgi:hypothetical protein
MNDTVVIADDSAETMQTAELSLKALKHVFIVRPHGLNTEQIVYLKRLAEESGVVLQTGAGYMFCPAYYALTQETLSANVIDIKHQLACSGDVYGQLRMELLYGFDFVTNVLNVGISRFNIKSWKSSDNLPNIINCRLECDNGCLINLMAYTVMKGNPKFDITFFSSETVISADVFNSIIKRQYRTGCSEDSIILNAYCEKTVFNNYLDNFYRAVGNESGAVRIIDRQFQNMTVANSIITAIRDR